jgi:HK97 family phage major capsid protein
MNVNLIKWVERQRVATVKALESNAGDVGHGVHVHVHRTEPKRTKKMETVTKRGRRYAANHLGLAADASDRRVYKALGRALRDGEITGGQFDKMTVGEDGSYSVRDSRPARSKGASIYRVKDVSEKYSTKRHTGKHVRTGSAIFHNGKAVETPSELDFAKAACWLRLLARKAGIPMPASDHEQAMVAEMWDHDRFLYAPGETEAYEVSGRRAQDLFNDSTSGGLYINPVWFDQAIVTYPLLQGQLTPFVDLVDMPRGSLVNTAAIGNPTATWQASEQSASITPFDATGLISPITATVTPVAIAVKFGRDLGSDQAGPSLGETLMGLLGQRLAAELDNVIAVGNGSTQPLGVFNSSGITVINSSNSTGGPPTVGDYESLLFGVPKQYRSLPAMNISFIGNDISYRKARSIPVGPGDERRVLLMDEQSYEVLGVPYRIAVNVPNNQVACLPLKKYRLWRRLAQEMTFTIEGQTLVLANEALLVMRGRYAGRVVDVNSAVQCNDMES